MTRTTDSEARLLAAAASEVQSAAWWERIDLETRRPGLNHQELLLARAAELAMSPIGREQLMSLALERSVDGVDRETPLISPAVPSAERAGIVKRVFECGPRRSVETGALVSQIEEGHARRLGREARFDLLPGRLLRDAILHEMLWDHPDIPASYDVRLTMLCSIPKLIERSEDLSCGWSWKALPRWFSSGAGRGVR